MILNIEMPNVEYELMPEILAYKLAETSTSEQADFLFEFIGDLTDTQLNSLANALTKYRAYGESVLIFFEGMTEKIRAEMIAKYKEDYR